MVVSINNDDKDKPLILVVKYNVHTFKPKMTQKTLNETNLNQVVTSSHFIDSNLQSDFIKKKYRNFDLEGDKFKILDIEKDKK